MKTGSGLADRSTTKEALNCVRVLARVLPVIFDVEGESSIFETEVMWRRHEVEDHDAPDASDTTQFVIDDEDDSDNDTNDVTLNQPLPRRLLATGGTHAHGGLEGVVDPPLEACTNASILLRTHRRG